MWRHRAGHSGCGHLARSSAALRPRCAAWRAASRRATSAPRAHRATRRARGRRPSARAPAAPRATARPCAASSNGAIVATPGAAHVQRTLLVASSACARRSNVNAGDAAATASPNSALRPSRWTAALVQLQRARRAAAHSPEQSGAGGAAGCGAARGSRRAVRWLGEFAALVRCGHAA